MRGGRAPCGNFFRKLFYDYDMWWGNLNMGFAFHEQFRCHDFFGIMVTLSDALAS